MMFETISDPHHPIHPPLLLFQAPYLFSSSATGDRPRRYQEVKPSEGCQRAFFRNRGVLEEIGNPRKRDSKFHLSAIRLE